MIILSSIKEEHRKKEIIKTEHKTNTNQTFT